MLGDWTEWGTFIVAEKGMLEGENLRRGVIRTNVQGDRGHCEW